MRILSSSASVSKTSPTDTKLKGKQSPFGMFSIMNHQPLPDSPGNPIHTQRSHWLLGSLSKANSTMEKMSWSWFHVGHTGRVLSRGGRVVGGHSSLRLKSLPFKYLGVSSLLSVNGSHNSHADYLEEEWTAELHRVLFKHRVPPVCVGTQT